MNKIFSRIDNFSFRIVLFDCARSRGDISITNHAAEPTSFCNSALCLRKVPIDGGDPVQLTDKPSGRPVISPDGKLIACGYSDGQNVPLKIAVIPFEGGQPLKKFDIPQTVFNHFFDSLLIRWTPDGHALSYMDIRDGISNVWTQPLDGGEPKQITDFKTNRMFFFDWSRDGKQLAMARGSVTNDVVLISNFK